MIEVKLHKEEKIDSALKRFKRKVLREGFIKEIRARQYFVRPAEKRRQKSKLARRRKLRDERIEGAAMI